MSMSRLLILALALFTTSFSAHAIDRGIPRGFKVIRVGVPDAYAFGYSCSEQLLDASNPAAEGRSGVFAASGILQLRPTLYHEASNRSILIEATLQNPGFCEMLNKLIADGQPFDALVQSYSVRTTSGAWAESNVYDLITVEPSIRNALTPTILPQ